jgi:hypothetical protein
MERWKRNRVGGLVQDHVTFAFRDAEIETPRAYADGYR